MTSARPFQRRTSPSMRCPRRGALSGKPLTLRSDPKRPDCRPPSTWSSRPLLGRVAEIGRTQRCLPREWNDWFTRTAMPTLRIPDFNMSSVFPAS